MGRFLFLTLISVVGVGAFNSPVLAAKSKTQASRTSAKQPTAEFILQKADEVRCPPTSYVMEVDVINTGDKETVKVEVFTKGREKTRVNTLAPVRDRGRNMLMVGEDMWAYIPNLRRSVRVALNQKLTGQAAIGDVSRMRWWGDYSAEIEGNDRQTWKLLLRASKKGLTYEKIRVRISKKNFRPLDAEYLTADGLVLKTAQFGAYRKIAGEIRPTQIVITNPHNPEESSTLRILKLEQRESSDRIFNQNSLN